MPTARSNIMLPLLALLLLLSGCAYRNIPKGGEPKEGEAFGYVFGTVGMAGGTAMNDKISECALIYRPVQSSSNDSPGRLHFYNPQDIVDHLLDPGLHTSTDFRDGPAKGTLFLVRLRPGRYNSPTPILPICPIRA